MSSANEVKTPLREIRLRVAMCAAVVFLAIDDINPVKVICSIVGLDTRWIALGAFIYIGTVCYTNAKDLLYFLVKVFFHSLLSIFFSSIEVLGRQNIPEHGPVIFTGNHMNQFVDAAVVLVTTTLPVGFLVAEVSFKKPIIGDFARAAGGIPVSRPQDFAKRGPGKIMVVAEGHKLIGEDTLFTQWKKGDKFRPGRSPNAYRLKEVISDTEAIVSVDIGEPSPLEDPFLLDWETYDLLAAVDQSQMFETVQNELAKGKCLGIFPEGGSHDRTDLLPLKVGVAAIAFGVLEKHDRNVPIVPVGLNYFRGHRFRGRVVVEFGEPVQIDKETLSVYKKSKRLGYQALLSKVEEGMRSVIVTAPNYNELKLIHTVRRVYQRTPSAMMPSNPTKYRQDMARRMSVGYQLLKDKYNGEEYLPQEVLDLKKRFEDYQDTLEQWGIRDYQVNQLDVPFNTLLYTFMHAFIVILLASIPTLILNAPVGLLASYYASKQAKKDLKASRVKLAARDVLMSKKIVFSLVAVPVLWISYAVLMLLFTNWEPRTILVLLLLCPYFAYIGATGLGMGMVDVKDLKPALLRLLPAFQRVVKTLPGTRAQLQKDVRIMMKKYGPSLGAVYHDKSDGWEKRVQLPCSSSDANLEETGRCVSNEGEAAEGTTEHMREPSTEYVEDVRTRSGSTISNHCDLEDTADMLNFSTGVSVDLPLEGEIGRIHNEHEVESISDLDHVVDELINQGSKKDN